MFTSIQTYFPGIVDTRLVLAQFAARGRAHDDIALARRLAP
jgi:hypothetical protein